MMGTGEGGGGIGKGDLRGGSVWRDMTIYSTAEPCPMVSTCFTSSHLPPSSLLCLGDGRKKHRIFH